MLDKLIDYEHEDNRNTERDKTKTQVLKKMAELEIELQEGIKPMYMKRKPEHSISNHEPTFKKRVIKKNAKLNLDD